MRFRLLFLTLAVALLFISLPASATSYYDPALALQQGLCWDGSSYVSCDPNFTQTTYTVAGDPSSSTTICRASYGDPSTWCYAAFGFVCDPGGGNCTRACVRTTGSGGCSCDKTFTIHGSCIMNS